MWRVTDFISNNQWNINTLNLVFWQSDMRYILRIPLSREVAENQLIWHYDRNGRYTIKSEFWLAREITRRKSQISGDGVDKKWGGTNYGF